MPQNIITADKLTKVYKSIAVVDNVSFDIPEGAICGLIGRNGAGKTTLLRLLTGLALPTSGTYSICNGLARTDSSVAAIVERPMLFDSMSAADNLILQSRVLGLDSDVNYIASTLELVGLDIKNKLKVKKYSLGMRQRLAIAVCLLGKPRLLLLDEPINGLDPQGINDMRRLLQQLNSQMGVTIVISSHILSELDKLATHYLIMDKGKVVQSLTAQQMAGYNRTYLRLVVDNADNAVQVLLSNGYKDVVAAGKTIVKVYDDIPSTQVLLCLAQNGVAVKSVNTEGGGLEDVYLNMIGGNR